MNGYAPLMIVPYSINQGPSPRRVLATQTTTAQTPGELLARVNTPVGSGDPLQKDKQAISIQLVLVLAIGLFLTGTSRLEAETREVIADPTLSAGPLHRLFFGNDYRDLWTTPIDIEVLDLSREAGGLEAAFRVGGAQTFGLAFKGADGKSYTFRSLVKNQTQNLNADLRDSFIGRISQDQLASIHPASTSMVPPLAKAAGVLHNTPRLVVLPDDPALGEFRELFAGRVGTIEEFPTKASDTYEGFEKATDIIKSEELVTRWLASPAVRVDATELLRLRLFDFFLGDWDRHANNHRWAKLPGKPEWQPLPEDRDQAFVTFEGVALAILRPYEPRLLKYEEEYPSSFGLIAQGWPIHRWFMAELDRDAWIDMANELKTRITDEAINEAVSLMPKPYFDLTAETLVHTMKARRDRLPEIADRIYRYTNAEVDVQATDQSDHIDLRDPGDGLIEVSIASTAGATPYFKRQLNPTETKSLRVHLRDGQNTVMCHGTLNRKIKIDVIGSQAQDELQGCETANLRFTETEEIERRKTNPRVKPSPFSKIGLPTKNIPPESDRPRDWRHSAVPTYRASVSSTDGLIFSYGRDFRVFEFGKNPFGQRHKVSAAVSPGRAAFDVNYNGTFQHWDPNHQTTFTANLSGIEQAYFFGFGNDTTDEGDNDFFETDKTQVNFGTGTSYLASPDLKLFSGVLFNFSSTDDDDNTLLSELAPLGVGDFSWATIFAGFDYDTRDHRAVIKPGMRIELKAGFSPGVFDVDSSFGSIEGRASGFFRAGERSMVVLRIGGRNISGTFPFQEAAYIGGATTVRGLDENRFAGDASIFANAEFRYAIGTASAWLPKAEYSVLVFSDVGRVFSDINVDSDQYHGSLGTGISVSALDDTLLASLAFTVSDEGGSVIFDAGFGF